VGRLGIVVSSRGGDDCAVVVLALVVVGVVGRRGSDVDAGVDDRSRETAIGDSSSSRVNGANGDSEVVGRDGGVVLDIVSVGRT
jgi:hypothetical protein